MFFLEQVQEEQLLEELRGTKLNMEMQRVILNGLSGDISLADFA